jgi:alpha-mannosidase
LKTTVKSKITKVDKIVKQLEKSFVLPLDNWKLTTDMSFTPTVLSNPNFNDSKWRKFSINEEDVFPNGCWLRKVITIPEKIDGVKVTGQLNLKISINDIAKLWVNGKFKGSWQWDKTITLTKNAKPGEKIILLIKGYSNHPMYLFWLSEVFLILQKNEAVKKITDNLILSFKTAQKLLGPDTIQKNGFLSYDPKIDKSTIDKKYKKELVDKLQNIASEVNIDAISNGKYNEFLTSVKVIKNKLKPFADFAKQFTFFFLANAHMDAEWLWRENEIIEVAKRTFESTLNLMDKKNDLTFAQTSAAYYEWMETYHPKIFKRIQRKVKEGNWEIIGGMWIEPDCNMPDGESWAKQFLYAQKYFEKKFNKKPKIAFNPDSFGFNWNMPQFLNKANIEFFVTTKITWNDTNVFPYHLFWWESPDGSRVLSYIPETYMNKIDKPFNMVDFARRFEANTGLKEILFLFGIGDHGGGPSWEMLKRIERLKKVWIFPKVEFITMEKYFNILKKQNLSDVPTWKDELYLEFHRGTYTSQAKTKKLNREGEVLLNNAEKLSVLAGINENNKIETAWKKIIFNQFHDILPGTSIPSVYQDVYEKYEKAFQLANYVKNKSLKILSEKINTNILPKGEPLILFNLLPWDRKDMVKYNLPEGDKDDYVIYDIKGREIPSQIIPIDELNNQILFQADIPAIGYKVYGIKKQTSKVYKTDLKIDDNTIENKFFKIEINKKSGWIKQITDKRNGKKMLTAEGNKLQMFGNNVPLWKAWNINYTGKKFHTKFVSAKIIEQGAVRTIYRIKHNFSHPEIRKPYPTENFPTSFFTQDIILYNNMDIIEFKTVVDWWENEIILKTAFPLNIKGNNVTYEIPYGSIYRSSNLSKRKNKGKFEVPALRWADLSENDYGVSLINNSKYGYDTNKNIMRLTLLNAPLWPDPNANRGKNIIEYRIYPHMGEWKKNKTIRKGYEFNNPILTFPSKRHTGKFKLKHSFVKVNPDNIILSTIKFAEGKKDIWIIQCFETEGKDTAVQITLPSSPKKAILSNFLEENVGIVKVDNRNIYLTNKAYSIITIKVYF